MIANLYPQLDLLSQTAGHTLFRDETPGSWTGAPTTEFGRSQWNAADAAAGRALLAAARTDGPNTFTGTQTFSLGASIPSPYGLGLRFLTDSTNNVAYFDMATDSTHAVSLVNRTGTKTALTLQGASGQSRPLLELQDSLGAELFSITSVGSLQFRNSSGTSTGVLVTDFVGQGGVALLSAARLDLQGSTIYFKPTAGSPDGNYSSIVKFSDATGGNTLSLYTQWRSNTLTLLSGTDGTGNYAPGTYAGIQCGAATAANIPLICTGTTGQTGNLTEWRNVGGAVVASVTGGGGAGFNYVLTDRSDAYAFGFAGGAYFQRSSTTGVVKFVLQNYSGASFAIDNSSGSSGTAPLAINLASGQTANAIEVRDSLNAILTAFNSSGFWYRGSTRFLHNSANNVFVGLGAGNFTLSSDYNIAVGSGNLAALTTGQRNVALGHGVLPLNTTGYDNIGIGNQSLAQSVESINNVAIGYLALFTYNLSGGGGNTAVGHQAMRHATTGQNNAAVGEYAMIIATTGSNNTVIGGEAGTNGASGSASLTTGDNNVFVGYRASGSASDTTNAIAIGKDAVSASNTTTIGNTSTTATNLYGDVECLTATKGFVLQSPDTTRWRITVSDAGVVGATAV